MIHRLRPAAHIGSAVGRAGALAHRDHREHRGGEAKEERGKGQAISFPQRDFFSCFSVTSVPSVAKSTFTNARHGGRQSRSSSSSSRGPPRGGRRGGGTVGRPAGAVTMQFGQAIALLRRQDLFDLGMHFPLQLVELFALVAAQIELVDNVWRQQGRKQARAGTAIRRRRAATRAVIIARAARRTTARAIIVARRWTATRTVIVEPWTTPRTIVITRRRTTPRAVVVARSAPTAATRGPVATRRTRRHWRAAVLSRESLPSPSLSSFLSTSAAAAISCVESAGRRGRYPKHPTAGWEVAAGLPGRGGRRSRSGPGGPGGCGSRRRRQRDRQNRGGPQHYSSHRYLLVHGQVKSAPLATCSSHAAKSSKANLKRR